MTARRAATGVYVGAVLVVAVAGALWAVVLVAVFWGAALAVLPWRSP